MSFRPRFFFIVLGLAGFFWQSAGRGQSPTTSTTYRKIRTNSAAKGNRIEALKKDIEENSADLGARIELARILIRQKRSADAIVYLKPVMNQLPRRGLLFLAKAYHLQKDYLNEIRTLMHMIGDSQSDYVGETLLGEAFSADSKPVDAIKHFRNAIQINPRFKDSYWDLLKQFQGKENIYERRELLEQMHNTFGDEPDVMDRLCTIYTNDNYIDQGIKACERAVELHPSLPDNQVNLGLNHKYRNEKPVAKRILYQAAKQFPNSDFAQCAAGDIAQDTDDVEGAAAFYLRGTVINPKSLPCQLGLAKTSFATGDYATSLKAYVAACNINRKYALTMRIKAGFLRQKNLDDWKEKFITAANQCD